MRALFALALLSLLLAAAQLPPQDQAQVDAFMVKWRAEQAADEADAKQVCRAGGRGGGAADRRHVRAANAQVHVHRPG
ncbi:MAG: hypothetical protein KGZ70_01280 [Hydrogenophaga sp.]|nr:hypothetical protein [Hydrogenophaga sp.]